MVDVVDGLADELSSSSLLLAPPKPEQEQEEEHQQEQERRQQHRPTTLDDLPHDVLVTIFNVAQDPRWVTKTFPFVCRAWRDLYLSRDASPLHYCLYLDLRVDRASRVLAWARRHAEDVKVLSIAEMGPGDRVKDFTESDLAALVSLVGAGLVMLNVEEGCGSAMLRARFWAALEGVFNTRQPGGCGLQALYLRGIRVALPASFAEALGRCMCLKAIMVNCEAVPAPAAEGVGGRGAGTGAGAGAGGPQPLRTRRVPGARGNINNRNSANWGFRGFPCSLFGLPRMEFIILGNHLGIGSLPARIAELKNLRKLFLHNCSLRSLPPELGTLKELRSLDVGENRGLSSADEAEAFPAALSGMTAMRELRIQQCGLRRVPSFFGAFKALEQLYLHENDFSSPDGAAVWPATFPKLPDMKRLVMHSSRLQVVPPAVLSSMPGLVELFIGNNRIRELPADFGRRMQALEALDMRRNDFAAVPVAELAGARELEELDFRRNERLQVEEPIDELLKNHPRLKSIKLWKEGRNAWSRTSAINVAGFAMKLKERDPEALKSLISEPTD